MKIIEVKTHRGTLCLILGEDKIGWEVECSQEGAEEVNQELVNLLNLGFLPDMRVYSITPYADLVERIKQELAFMRPQVQMLVPEYPHGEDVPEGAII